MLLVTARRKDSSLSVGVATAADAVKKVSDLEGEGYVAFVFDCTGRERPIEELRAQALGEEATTPSALVDRP